MTTTADASAKTTPSRVAETAEDPVRRDDESASSVRKPGRRVQAIVSLVVALHLFALLTAVTSSGSGKYTSPYTAVKLNEPFRPYLEVLFLRNGYRFFAPNPGPNFVAWFRVTYDDGRVRWVEFPRRQDFATPLAYTRMLSVANMGAYTYPHPQDPDKGSIRPATQICLQSFARRIARDAGKNADAWEVRDAKGGERDTGGEVKTSDGGGRVVSVEAYRVAHLYIMPDQIREGWDYTDLRLYQPMYLGAFSADGSPIDPDATRYCETPIMVCDMICHDIAPELMKVPPAEQTPQRLAAELERLGIPEPVRRLVQQNPQLISTASAEVSETLLHLLELVHEES
ncbi:hypothetical protein [Roseimaritima sediminicola]|uniref:hypothetical protein n=1 Tax=Roseimaritima sediminicola TaxID=2662066 RepID=UPI0012983542|nr:hypothetical protein [Roseimaritima sediminicola]